jgi:hypothetical protein
MHAWLCIRHPGCGSHTVAVHVLEQMDRDTPEVCDPE